MVTGTNKQEFSDSGFTTADTSLCHLSIETGDDFLCCAVHEITTGKLLAIDSEKPAYLDQSFRGVSCAIVNPYFTLVPNDVFDKDQVETYLGLNVSIQPQMVIHYNQIAALNAYSVYAADKDFEEKLEKKFPAVILRHITATTIEKVLARSESDKNIVWVNVYRGIFELIIIVEGKLKFCNLFDFKVHEDITYYIHYSLEQLQINAGDAEIILTGPFAHPVLEGFLKKFFKVNVPEANANLENYKNRFYTLIHQQACV